MERIRVFISLFIYSKHIPVLTAHFGIYFRQHQHPTHHARNHILVLLSQPLYSIVTLQNMNCGEQSSQVVRRIAL